MNWLISILALFPQLGSLPGPPPPDKVVVSVNGHGITAKEVQAYMWDWKIGEVAQTLGVFEAIRQECEKYGITLKQADVDSKVGIAVQQTLASAPKNLSQDEALRSRGATRSLIEFRARAQMMLEALASKNFHASDFYQVGTLVVSVKSQNAADLQSALTASNKAYEALAKGETWEKVISQYATDPQNATNHGDLGWRPISSFPQGVQGELQTLKVGSFTKPVQTQFGMQIFRLEARGKDAGVNQVANLRGMYLPEEERAIVQRLQQTSKIVISY